MEFEHTLPEWKNEGKEPSETLKTSGFQKGDRPAATIFNWFWSKTAKAITELQTKMTTIQTSSSSGLVGTEEEMNDNYIADIAQTYMVNCTAELSSDTNTLTVTPIDSTREYYMFFRSLTPESQNGASITFSAPGSGVPEPYLSIGTDIDPEAGYPDESAVYGGATFSIIPYLDNCALPYIAVMSVWTNGSEQMSSFAGISPNSEQTATVTCGAGALGVDNCWEIYAEGSTAYPTVTATYPFYNMVGCIWAKPANGINYPLRVSGIPMSIEF